ncbi:cysteine-rich CWC family protein [Sediminibacterium soli]|uniref:cysteine-rich CWC family protein n=1 Tax=Sediminibacterium soli TaxID=2698829 RepID=UPI00137B5B88|nr:cysteine-rich CWC family protein [Sediminibacterium soli]NCI45416.1 cysteine-rich CWC family protein [Sediminibacterium soli]
MPTHETKKCPRCARPFECKVGNIAECQCSQVTLSYEQKAYIELQYTDCLCAQCLQALQFEQQLAKHHLKRQA